MLSIVICDDMQEHLHHTERLVRDALSEYPHEIILFSDPEEMMRLICDEAIKPDIAVLDIMLGQEDGISLAQELHRLLPHCQIIFISGYPQYISESYQAPHVWYLLKSDAEKYMKQALERAIDSMNGGYPNQGLIAKSGGKTFVLPLHEILYLERVGRKTRIVCLDTEYTVSGSPQTLILPGTESSFVHCHQGYWVNLQKIKALEREEFVLQNDTRIPISRSCRDEARERFFARFL